MNPYLFQEKVCLFQRAENWHFWKKINSLSTYFDSSTKIPLPLCFRADKNKQQNFVKRKIRIRWFRVGYLFWWISSWCCIKKSIPFMTPITIKGPAHAQIFNVFQHINIVVICKLLIRSSFIFFTTTPHVIDSWRWCIPKKNTKIPFFF